MTATLSDLAATSQPACAISPPHDASESPAATAESVRQRVCRESRLIARLMATEPPQLHDECERLAIPHEGRSPDELRAALFTRLRRIAS